MRPLFSRGKWICRFHQAGEKRSRSSTRASLSRLASASRLGGEERRPRLIAHAFRRNGVGVPAQRHHRSGATASPFRRDGITVPAQRHHRSGATASPFRRNGVTVPAQRHPRSGAFGPPSGAFPAGETGRPPASHPGFQPISAYFMIDFNRKSKLTDNFASAGDPFSCPREFFLMGTRIPSVRDATLPDR